MRVKLASLKDNPMRDLTVDPIDDETVEKLKASITQHGFWNGVCIRKTADNEMHIVAGHHRVRAALAAGRKHADFPKEAIRTNLSDSDLINIYATENATQRGNTAAASAGTVASAIRLLVREALRSGDASPETRRVRTQLKYPAGGGIVPSGGIGTELIFDRLKGVPGISRTVIRDQIANLKKSGNYGRILEEEAAAMLSGTAVQNGIVSEAEDFARHLLAIGIELRRSAVFDLAGITHHFPLDRQVTAFRELVLAEGLRDAEGRVFVGLDEQAALAKMLVDKATELDAELSVGFIKQYTYSIAAQAKGIQEAGERARIQTVDAGQRMQFYLNRFSRYVSGMRRMGRLIAELRDQAPHIPIPITGRFLDTVQDSVSTINQLNRLITDVAPADDRCELCGQHLPIERFQPNGSSAMITDQRSQQEDHSDA